MTINTVPLNTQAINAVNSAKALYSGAVLSFSQNIQTKYTTSVLGVTQNVLFLETFSEQSICSISQKIKSTQNASPVYSVTQMVIS